MPRKRKGKNISGSPGNQSSSSPASSPEEKSVCKKVAMSAGYSPSNADVMAAIAEIAKQNADMFDRLESKVDSINERLDKFKGMQAEVTEVKKRIETLHKRILRKTVVIHGLADSQEDNSVKTEQKVRELANILGVTHLDVDFAIRMGKYQEGKIRPVELTLVRQKQIMELLKLKSKLKGNEATKLVYIDEAYTPDERVKRSKLLAYAKLHKATRFRFVGREVMEMHSGGKSGKIHVNEDGKVVAWTERTGDGTSNGRANHQARS